MSELVRLSILESYGVQWSREVLARDVMQNFFDAHGDFDRIRLQIDREAGVVEVEGEEGFDLKLLFFIGATTKHDGSTVGGFGEGFKICALVATRDFGVRVLAGSGDVALEVVLEPVPLGRELCYRIERGVGDATRGAWVRLEGCEGALMDAFAGTPDLFRHKDHPGLQRLVAASADGRAAVFEAPHSYEGQIFYRRQLRGTVPFAGGRERSPLTICYDDVIDALEGDRDRRDVRMRPVALALGMKLDPQDIYAILLRMEYSWEYGHELVMGLLDAAIKRKLTFTWPHGWLAASKKDRTLFETARRLDYKLALVTFKEVGMPALADFFKPTLELRDPTPREQARYNVAAGLYDAWIRKPFKDRPLAVFDDPEGHAALRGQHLPDRIVVGARHFEEPMAGVGATILHELAHEAGDDQDPRFWRRLEHLLACAIQRPGEVLDAQARYDAITDDEAARRVLDTTPAAPPPLPPTWIVAAEGFDERTIKVANAHLLDFPEHTQRVVGAVLLLPLLWPPAAELLARLEALAQEVDASLFAFRCASTTEHGARSWGAQGLPRIFIGGVEIEPQPDAPRGYRVRTFTGDDGAPALLPGVAALRAAIASGVREGRRPLDTLMDEQDRVLNAIRLKSNPRPAAEPQQPGQRLLKALEARVLEAYPSKVYYDLRHAWGVACHAAARALAARTAARTPEADPEEAWSRITEAIHRVTRHTHPLRRADADFDEADALEREAMAAAQAFALLAALLGDAEDADLEAASAAFAQARAVTARAFRADVSAETRKHLLACFLDPDLRGADKGTFSLEGFDAEVDALLERVIAWEKEAWYRGEADIAMQVYEHHLKRRSPPAPQRPPEDPRLKWQAAVDQLRAHYARTQALIEAFDQDVAATGDPIEASRLHLERVRTPEPEASAGAAS